jgi:hypothetical protein
MPQAQPNESAQMDRNGREQQTSAPCLAREEDRAGGLGRLQRVGATKQRLGG